MRAELDASYDAVQLGFDQGIYGEAMEAMVQANIMTRTCMLAVVLPKVSHAVQLAGLNQPLLVSRLRGCSQHRR